MKKPSVAFKTFVIVTAAVAVGAFAIAALIAAASRFDGVRLLGGWDAVTVDEQKDIPAAGAKRIEVDTSSPDVRITSSPDQTVHAHLSGSAAGWDGEAKPLLFTRTSADGVITVRVEYEIGLVIGFSVERLVLEVAVPARFPDLSVTTSSGEVRVDNVELGSLVVRTGSGDISAGSLTVRGVSLSTTSGEVRAEALKSGTAAVRTSSGDVRLGAVTGGLSVVTSSGEVAALFTAQPAAVDVQADSGDVTLTLPSDAGFLLDARASSGDVACDFPITVSQTRDRGEHELSGTVGKGGVSVKVRTSSGEIRILK